MLCNNPRTKKIETKIFSQSSFNQSGEFFNLFFKKREEKKAFRLIFSAFLVKTVDKSVVKWIKVGKSGLQVGESGV